MTYVKGMTPLPSWERSTRGARRERGRRRRRLLRGRHPLPNPSPIKGEGLRADRERKMPNDHRRRPKGELRTQRVMMLRQCKWR